MKPVAFDYARPCTVGEACTLLAGDPEARVIAGGQTLIPLLAMRLARPSRLIDIARITELSGIEDCGSHIAIGAATRQVLVERDPLVAHKLPLLAKALPYVGHAAIRTRGTIGGSLVNGDPAAEIPLVAVTLRATLVVQTMAGITEIAIDDFYLGPMLTALPEGGVLVAVHLPACDGPGCGAGFCEVANRASDFALVAAAAQIAIDRDGRCIELSVGIGGATDRPMRLDGIADALAGTTLEEAAVRYATIAATAALDTIEDQHASATYRKRVAATLARRAILEAKTEALHSHAR